MMKEISIKPTEKKRTTTEDTKNESRKTSRVSK